MRKLTFILITIFVIYCIAIIIFVPKEHKQTGNDLEVSNKDNYWDQMIDTKIL